MTQALVLLSILFSMTTMAKPLDINVCYKVFGQKDCVRIYQKKRKFVFKQIQTHGLSNSRKISSVQAKQYKFTIRRLSHATYGRSGKKCNEMVIWQEKSHEQVRICVTNQNRGKKMKLRNLISQIIE